MKMDKKAAFPQLKILHTLISKLQICQGGGILE